MIIAAIVAAAAVDAAAAQGTVKAEYLLTGAESGNAECFIHGVISLLSFSYILWRKETQGAGGANDLSG